jgi:uncharacterized iron-regulated protein
MTTVRLAAVIAVVLPFALSAGDGGTPRADLDKQLRELEKEIEKVRGLKFKSPVVASVIPRPKAGAEGVQGYYDTKKKALFLFDDVKGNYFKGTLIHEMVHALQDQHFGLSRQDDAPLDSDTELARAALIEGDATYTMIELLQKEQPHVTKMLSTSLETAKNLRNAFLYGLGARYVQGLKKRGGWKAVNDRYRFPPTSTAAILHPDERITPVNLGPGRPLGELGIIKLLGAHPATQAQAVQAAAGWRGDRMFTEGDAKARVVAFAKPEQAARFAAALRALRAAEGAAKGKHEVLVRGSRVWDLSAPDEKGYRALLDRVEGPPKVAVWSTKEKKAIPFGEFTDRLLEHDLICVGENHDSEADHAVQLMILKALFARDERLGVGMEMFQRPFQKALDRYVSGATDEATFLEDSEYQKRWGYDWALYRPIVEFCRRNRVSLAALNLRDELRGKLSKDGYDKLTAEEKKQLGEIDFHVKAHRAHWFDRLGEMHGHGKMTEEAKEKFYQVMTAWDEYMADSAARFQKERRLRRMVVFAGGGHIERGFGIPDRAVKRTGGKAATVTVQVGADLAKLSAAAPDADFVVIVR